MPSPGLPNKWIVSAASGATRTFVCPTGHRGTALQIHGSSSAGGSASINLGAVGGVKQLGLIPTNGRLDIGFTPGLWVGDRSTNIVLTVPADFDGHMSGDSEATLP